MKNINKKALEEVILKLIGKVATFNAIFDELKNMGYNPLEELLLIQNSAIYDYKTKNNAEYASIVSYNDINAVAITDKTYNIISLRKD